MKSDAANYLFLYKGSMLDLSALTPTNFEEFCFDLLICLGASNVSWRKGSNSPGSPADQGRDIQCEWEIEEIGGEKHREKWFIECKHYKDAVSPEKLQGAFAWADAEKPDVLLVIASGFLSNPTKNYIESRTRNSGTSYRIRVWENKDLERFASSHPSILRKHQISWDIRFFEYMHPVHVEYLRKPPLNSLNYFLSILDGCELTFRRRAFGMAFLAIINPSLRTPEDIQQQTLGELADKPVSYTEFKTKCQALSPSIFGGFLVQAIVTEALRSTFSHADPTAIEDQKDFFRHTIKMAQDGVLIGTDYPEGSRSMVEHATSMLEKVGVGFSESVSFYFEFCEKVIAPLFEEPLPELPPEAWDYFEQIKAKRTFGHD